MKDVVELHSGEKFRDPLMTATGEERAEVALARLETLWFNTGTLCNIACPNCYILSSPKNDSLVYLSLADVENYLSQIAELDEPVSEIGFTGGEPFMNPDMIAMARAALEAGHEVLILTNAMRPMMRRSMRAGIEDLQRRFGDRMTLRISLDHWSAALHDEERGTGSFCISLEGMRWLRDQGVRMTVAGRTMWGETESRARDGYATLYAKEGFEIDAYNPADTVLFPEMDETADVPEITTACWDVLGRSPEQVMCSSSRMVVKRKGTEHPAVVACTLLPYDAQFELGRFLKEASRPVRLNHPHCAKFCVLGGASCSA
ncbi:MAG: radical SAM protein [Boseongicola sp. SB0677_bin_26]|nr:radical SAM protein [Boseongicola sp. SB0665_bin_10]MYG26784.1 radical SAM protein [Boseongicola sp. SB0677_bin_26]